MHIIRHLAINWERQSQFGLAFTPEKFKTKQCYAFNGDVYRERARESDNPEDKIENLQNSLRILSGPSMVS